MKTASIPSRRWLQSAPGANLLHALSALAHGEEGHTFWRWDSCPFGHEQDLQGLVDWAGTPRAKLREVGQLRAVLDEMAGLELPPLKPKIALIFSRLNYWGTHPYFGRAYYDGQSYKSYWPEIESFYQAIFDWGLGCDCVAPGDDLSGYDLVLAPGLCLVSDAELQNLRSYVQNGGTLFAGRKTFVKTPDNTYYLGARIERDAMKESMRQVLEMAKIDTFCPVPQGGQWVQRGEIAFLTNHTERELRFSLPSEMSALLGGAPAGGASAGLELRLLPFGFALARRCEND